MRRNNKGGRRGKPQAFRRSAPKGLFASNALDLKCGHGALLGVYCAECAAIKLEHDFAQLDAADMAHERDERRYDRALLFIAYLLVPAIFAGCVGAYFWRVLP